MRSGPPLPSSLNPRGGWSLGTRIELFCWQRHFKSTSFETYLFALVLYDNCILWLYNMCFGFFWNFFNLFFNFIHVETFEAWNHEWVKSYTHWRPFCGWWNLPSTSISRLYSLQLFTASTFLWGCVACAWIVMNMHNLHMNVLAIILSLYAYIWLKSYDCNSSLHMCL